MSLDAEASSGPRRLRVPPGRSPAPKTSSMEVGRHGGRVSDTACLRTCWPSRAQKGPRHLQRTGSEQRRSEPTHPKARLTVLRLGFAPSTLASARRATRTMSEHTRAGSIAAKGGSVLAAAQGSGLSSALFSRFSSVLLWPALQKKSEMRTFAFFIFPCKFESGPFHVAVFTDGSGCNGGNMEARGVGARQRRGTTDFFVGALPEAAAGWRCAAARPPSKTPNPQRSAPRASHISMRRISMRVSHACETCGWRAWQPSCRADPHLQRRAVGNALARCVAGVVSVATKALTSAAIVGAGDVACQTLLERRSLMARSTHAQHESQGPEHMGDTAVEGCGKAAASRPFDYARLGNMTLLGAVLVAPVLHVWYGFLGRKIPGSSVGPVVGRVALDQVVFAPTFIAVFFSALAVQPPGPVFPPRLHAASLGSRS
jgi:hypothetical protein